MARVHSVGDVINGFEIVSEKLGSGQYTMFYQARKGGRDVFLKEYTSPAVSVPWYKPYLEYEKLVLKRIESNPIKDNTNEILDIFEYKNTLYMAFEWVPNGKDLNSFLDENGDDTVGHCRFWNKRVIFAKLLMDCIKKLHAAGIVHCDLKPQNAVLIEDSSIKSGYRFRIADLDWSFIEDKTPPWITYKAQGYVGTPGYFSPEHLKGQKPTFASDVFTCGIILYETLCNDSPFPSDDDAYKENVMRYKPSEPVLLGNYPEVDNALICKMLKDCLNPDPTKRPTAAEIHSILLGRVASTSIRPGVSAVRPSASTSSPATSSSPATPPSDPKPAAPTVTPIQLVGSVSSLTANIKTAIGKVSLRSLCGDDGQYAATVQYTLVREGDSWFIEPNVDAANETLINGKKIVEKTQIKSGDQIGVGREASGVVKAVVTVK